MNPHDKTNAHTKRTGGLEVSKVLVRDLNKKRDFEGIPENCVFTDKVEDILSDENLDVVVELVGGADGVAKELTLGALSKGKHVVSANKALIAAHGDNIVNVMEENPSAKFGFEASVCGGIPIIHALQRDFIPDRVKRLSGVFNGTTNFILSSMELQGRGYDEVLKEAQDLGFAEADPTADVGGFDARSKLCILARLALGVRLNEAEVPLTGMQAISKDDFDYAKKLNCSIKLLGVVSRSSAGGKINAYVLPYFYIITHCENLHWNNNNNKQIRVSHARSPEQFDFENSRSYEYCGDHV